MVVNSIGGGNHGGPVEVLIIMVEVDGLGGGGGGLPSVGYGGNQVGMEQTYLFEIISTVKFYPKFLEIEVKILKQNITTPGSLPGTFWICLNEDLAV